MGHKPEYSKKRAEAQLEAMTVMAAQQAARDRKKKAKAVPFGNAKLPKKRIFTVTHKQAKGSQ